VRLVIDTNVLVSALIFKDSRHLPLRAAWAEKRITPLLSIPTYRELKKVLGYRMFDIGDDRIQEAIAALGPSIEWVTIDESLAASLPKCSDRDDQKFLDVALCGNADAIITYDKALLKLRRRGLAFSIRKPEEIIITTTSAVVQ
jgi:uncharacterized protein